MRPRFECTLPPEARSEMLTPRPRSSRQTPSRIARSGPPERTRKRERRTGWLMLGLCLIVLAGGICASRHQRSAADRAWEHGGPGRSPSAVVPPPSPHPGSGPARGMAVVPRAVLVHRVPRATPAHPLPPDESGMVVGRSYLIVMPYGLECRATYQGWLPSVDQLPAAGRRIGDMFAVGPASTPWIWICAPGMANADWLDP
jgi:hypothetical protein